MFLFLKRIIISDNYLPLSLYDYLTLSPHIHLFLHSFQENWHDNKKFWRFYQIPPSAIFQGGDDAMIFLQSVSNSGLQQLEILVHIFSCT